MWCTYKPNFCSECGERIARARWRLWTSRKFCVECARRFRKARILLPVLAGTTLFGIGLAAGRAARHAPPPLIIERSQPAPATTSAVALKPAPQSSNTKAATGATTPNASPPAYGPDGSSTERPTDSNEIVSMCGARTKKGTPCTRRVRGTGRCWQHKGMPAMLPASKLIVQG